MYSNILKDEAPQDDPIRKDLDLIVEQANRCKNIVGGLLNFARKNQVKLAETDFNKFVEKSIASIIKPDSVTINLHSSLEDPIVMIDQDQMMQVLTNLEKNAVEAMPNGGNINISLNGNASSVEINLSDTGVGIPKENMEKIFTPFFTTKDEDKGTGLGLSISYAIIKEMKGNIKVNSMVNEYTKITIELPLKNLIEHEYEKS